jgi:hypothetical protein
MKYRLTQLRDKKGNEIAAKDSCKRCHGMGIVGVFNPVKGSNGPITRIICRCCVTKKTEG